MRNSLFLVALISWCLCLPAPAQTENQTMQEKPVTTSAWLQQLQTFPSAFESVAKQKNVAFVIEATPRQKELTLEKAVEVERELSRKELTEIQKIDTLARAFDYEAEAVSDSLYILRKRYSDPKDLPFVTQAENENCLKNLKKALADTFPDCDPDTHRISLVQDINRFFPLSNMERIAGVPVNRLSSQQRLFVYQIAVHRYVDDWLGLQQCAYDFQKGINDKTAHYGWINHDKALLFGFIYPKTVRLPSGGQEKTFWKFRLSHGAVASIYGSTNFTVARKILGPRGTFLAEPDDPTAPSETSEKNLPGWQGTTLRQAISELSRRTEQESRPTKIQVSPEIEDKTVTLIGCETVTPQRVLSALSSVYGLRVTEPQKNVLLLTLPASRRIKNRKDLPLIVQECLPPPLLRAWKGSIQAEEERLIASGWYEQNQKGESLDMFDTTNPKIRELVEGTKRWRINIQAKEETVAGRYTEAVRLIRAKVQSRVAKPDGKLPMRDADPETRRLVSLLGMLEMLPHIQMFHDQRFPEYLLHLDKMLVTVERKKLSEADLLPKGITGSARNALARETQLQGKESIEIRLTYYDSEGKLQSGPAAFAVFSEDGKIRRIGMQ